MKVGFIVECGPKGAETEVIPYLAQLIAPGLDTDVIPLEKKPLLKQHCGGWAAQLLASGCDKVLIVWDLLPDWGEFEGRGCLHVDRQEIFQSLLTAGLQPDDGRVHLICIHKMLEAWLLADERALSHFLFPKPHRGEKIARRKNTEAVRDPKSALNTIFQTSRSPISQYVDWNHAFKIVKLLPDLKRIDRVASFKRFRDKLT